MDRKTTNRVISFLVDQQKVRNSSACFGQRGRLYCECGSWSNGPGLSVLEFLSGLHTFWRRVCLRLT